MTLIPLRIDYLTLGSVIMFYVSCFVCYRSSIHILFIDTAWKDPLTIHTMHFTMWFKDTLI